MSDIPSQDNPGAGERVTALFFQLVLQTSGLASMLLGQTPHPETGETVRDLDAARLLIDQLEMLEIKTQGNLSPEESQMLRQQLMALRMTYVEAIEKSDKPANTEAAEQPASDTASAAPSSEAPAKPAAAPEPEESKVKFTKKY